MGINLDKPHLWENDISQSIGFYNRWIFSLKGGIQRLER